MSNKKGNMLAELEGQEKKYAGDSGDLNVDIGQQSFHFYIAPLTPRQQLTGPWAPRRHEDNYSSERE